MPLAITIIADDLQSTQTRSLLAYHLQNMHQTTPPEHSFALDLSGLQKPDITVWSAWVTAAGEERRIAGMGALRELGVTRQCAQGEIKSMRTHPDFLRQGVGAAILDYIIETAKARGLQRLSLETGVGPDFAAALALYGSRGFRPGEAFASYVPSAYCQFLHLPLAG